MSSHLAWLEHLRQERVIAVIRTDSVESALATAFAIAKGGIRLIEITWNSPEPAALIEKLRAELPACQIGAGTLLSEQDAKDAIAAGAQFLFSPHVDIPLIELAVNEQVPVIPGALSPTEIVTAWQAGASCVKIFPIEALGGASYLKALRAPLGHIPLIPTGGVNGSNAGSLLAAGAIAVGLGSALMPKDLLQRQDWSGMAERVQAFLQTLNVQLQKEVCE
ncbi:MAG: bifunctional 4-hydroxy-2-oxoglutarate aldolase/2-dehydro-3-deoxy-phosphogluconate aldolase [Cyanobacteria bacterium P01_H01_bin.15]